MMNTTCMYFSEARSKVPSSTYPRLHSLRSFSLGLLRARISEALSYCDSWRMGIKPTPTLGSSIHLPLEDGHKAHPYWICVTLYHLIILALIDYQWCYFVSTKK